MKLFLQMAVFFAAFGSNGIVRAQEIVQEPICFMVINEAPYKIYGSLNTDFYTRPDGAKSRHKSVFRLDSNGSVDEAEGFPTDRSEFCSYGPFYEGRKLEFTLRTLFPIFACQTRIDQGPIIVTGYRKPEGGAVTEAKCFE